MFINVAILRTHSWPTSVHLCAMFLTVHDKLTHMWSFINLDQVVCLHWTLAQKCRSHSGRNIRSRWPTFVCDVFNCPRQTHMWTFINLDQVVFLHWTLAQKCRSHSGRNSRSRWPTFVCSVFNCPRQTRMWSFINLDQVVCLHWT